LCGKAELSEIIFEVTVRVSLRQVMSEWALQGNECALD
jgi:hypothetical protein